MQTGAEVAVMVRMRSDRLRAHSLEVASPPSSSWVYWLPSVSKAAQINTSMSDVAPPLSQDPGW